MANPRISALYYYPIKSLRGISAESVRVLPMGFEHDRRMMLVDANGMFMTQRQHPELATFSVVHRDDAFRVTHDSGESITIGADGQSSTLIPVSIWNSRLDAFTHTETIDRFFSDILGQMVRLVRIPEASVRRVDPRYGAKTDHVSFADGYPVLLTTDSSLAELNARLADPVPMDRFRPNIVLSASEPFAEDSWKIIATENVTIRLVKACDRCVIITTDQRSGQRSEEPLNTLSEYRKKDHGVYFGMNGIPDGAGTLAVGETVEVRN